MIAMGGHNWIVTMGKSVLKMKLSDYTGEYVGEIDEKYGNEIAKLSS